MNKLSVVLVSSLLFGCETPSPLGGINQDYQNEQFHDVKNISYRADSTKTVKNIIFMVGDGMGMAQIYSGLTANKGKLNLQNFKHIGLSKTNSSDKYITDSAAGATAFSTGIKTFNGAIGVGPDKKPIKTILEIAEENGLATGLVATSKITHATPASFIAHQVSREMYQEIAADFLTTDIDVFIGGDRDSFEKRDDGRNLIEELKKADYQIVTETSELNKITSGKLAGLVAPGHPANYSGGDDSEPRGELLSKATQTSIRILDQNDEGFFLMVEGSQIDWGGHANNTGYIVEEMLDFDRVIGEVLEFAAADGETLVVITADHETGGFGLLDGDLASGRVKGAFLTDYHTAVMVPVFAFGPGADAFMGMYENTDLYGKFMEAYGF